MDWLCVAWSWWEGAAPLLGLVEFGLLIVGTLWTWCYRRTLMGKIDALKEKVEAQTNDIRKGRAENTRLANYLVGKLGADGRNFVRLAKMGESRFEDAPTARLGRGDTAETEDT